MSIFNKLSTKSRIEKFSKFNKYFAFDHNTSILDIGAEIRHTDKCLPELIDSYTWKNNITALNINKKHIDRVKKKYPEIKAIVGDACNLPFNDKSFDIVFSNAVIEHVGNFEKQILMAKEVMRVGKSWFITTPYHWYPFEFHLRLPLVTWLPFQGYLSAGQLIAYNHAKKRYSFFNSKHKHLRLLSMKEIKTCFPSSTIIKQQITFMPETVIIVGGIINSN